MSDTADDTRPDEDDPGHQVDEDFLDDEDDE